MIYCSLCFKTKDGPGDKNFFKVPKDKHRRKQWGEICRIDFKKKTVWICKDHFLPSEIKKSGNKRVLRANTVPFIPPVKEPEKILEAAYKSELKCQVSEETIEQNSTKENLAQISTNEKLARELSSSFGTPSQRGKNVVMEIPFIKTVFCARSTQSNTRLCGLVQTSEFADDFRLNCFYCSDIFPFEKWKDFTLHLKEQHFEREKAFKTCEYISDEHDYTPTNLPTTSSLEPIFETIGVSPESLLPFLGHTEKSTIPTKTTFFYNVPENIKISNNLMVDAEKSFIMAQEYAHNHLDPMAVNPKICYNQIGNKKLSTSVVHNNKVPSHKNLAQILSVSHNSMNLKNKSSKQKIFNMSQMRIASKQAPRKTVLSRFLKRTIKKESKHKVKEVLSSGLTHIKQQNSPIISYEYSPSAVVDFLLDIMSNYPILWQFNIEPFNEEFCRSVNEMCEIINGKWSLNIDNLTMRRSINRVLRFYCYLFPNENIENIHQFTGYYDKCAEFLPASVNEIAYSRCYNCYTCFKCDFELKRHLLKEESLILKWHYKCVECKECFEDSDEYEYHKSLPHYVEVFRCEPCKKKYFRRNIYNKHISDYHPKENGNERRFKCDKCEKAFRTQGGLTGHKIYHGERKHKCHLCSKSYHENARLQIHLKTHRKQFDFICEVCAKEFVTQSALNVHMDKHTGEKITCTICNLKLRKSSLSRHLRLLHTPHDHNLSPNALPISKGKLRTYKRLVRTKPFLRKKECERRRYQCKVCMIHFERYKPLAEHNKAMHSDLPKWPCLLCGTLFTLKENLKSHYRKKHDLHVIQVYKLVEEGDNLSDVLSIKTEQLDMLAENSTQLNMKIPKIKSEFLSDDNFLDEENTEVKSEYLSDKNSLEEENMQSFSIEEEIMKATDNIAKEEIKIDYMSDFFTEMLK